MAIINGTNAADTLTTTSGDDVVRAYDGSDRIYASDGNDDIDGGSGYYGLDTLVFLLSDSAAFSSARDTHKLTLGRGVVFDDLGKIYTKFTGLERIDVNTRGTGDSDIVVDASGLDFTAGNLSSTPFSFYGGRRNDTVIGSMYNDVIRGGLGINDLDGGVGNDTVILTFDHTRTGTMVLSEVDRAVVSDQGGVRTNVARNFEVFTLTYDLEASPTRGLDVDASAVSKAFTFVGEDFADTVVGGSGNDVFYDFGAGDVLTGNGGADRYELGDAIAQFDGLTITDLSSDDTLSFSSLYYSGTILPTYIGTASFSGNAGEIRLVIGEASSAIVVDADGDGAGDATITLGNGASDLATITNFDGGLLALYPRLQVFGTEGDDTLTGSDRSDRFDGGAGNDTIKFGSEDIVTGGAGSDWFIAASGSTNSTITDFGLDDTLDYKRTYYGGYFYRSGDTIGDSTTRILLYGSSAYDFQVQVIGSQVLVNAQLRNYVISEPLAAYATDIVRSADGLIYVASGTQIVVLSATTQSEIARWDLPSEVYSLGLSDDGATLLAGSYGKVFEVASTTGAIMRTASLGGNVGGIRVIDATYAIITDSYSISRLDLQTFEVASFNPTNSYNTTVEVDENLLFLVGYFGDANIVGATDGVVRASRYSPNSTDFGSFTGGQAIDASANLVAIGFANGVQLLNLELQQIGFIRLPGDAPREIVFDPTGKTMFVMTTQTPAVKQIDIATGSVLAEYQIDGSPSFDRAYIGATKLILDPDGRHLTITDYDNTLRVIDISAGSETLHGTVLGETLSGYGGDDVLIGAGGNDTVDGGTGTDTLVLAGRHDGYTLLTDAGFTYLVGAEGAVKFVNVEILRFTDGEMTVDTAAATLAPFDAVRYLASNGDLIASGVDTAVAQAHFVASGFAEGRLAQSFNPTAYLETYGDLRAVYGNDLTAAEQHYVAFGYDEGRTINFDAIAYLAANADLIDAFGTDTAAATRHYFDLGIGEGRGMTFDYVGYLAANGDLAALVGLDAKAAALDYIVTGRAAGVDPGDFDGLRYIASQPDLITVFGNDAHAGALHYVLFGRDEHRDPLAFDPLLYGATNVDLALAFGTDAALLTNHYVVAGYAENRVTSGFDAVAYLLSNPDLAAAHLGVDGALQHWLAFGAAEGRSGDAAFGREQTSHSLLSYAQSTLLETPSDLDWFEVDLTAGKQMTVAFNGNFDPRLSIYDHDGNLIATDGRASSVFYSSEALTFTPEETGTYYVVVGADRAVYDYLNYSTSIYG